MTPQNNNFVGVKRPAEEFQENEQKKQKQTFQIPVTLEKYISCWTGMCSWNTSQKSEFKR
jgi:hypothetical protein